MKEYFQEASTGTVYRLFSSLKKPVFFIGLQDKSYLIFITKDIDFDSARRDGQCYVRARFCEYWKSEGQHWGIGLYNDTESR